MFRIVPGGFIPAQDKQYLHRRGAAAQCGIARPDRSGSSARCRKSRWRRRASSTRSGFPGLSANGFVNLDNAAVVFLPLADFDKRTTKALSAGALAQSLMGKFAAIGDANILVVSPPPVQGLGTTGGFKLYLQDRGGRGYDDLAKVTGDILNLARQQKELFGLATYTTFQNGVPQLFADVDRVKAKRQGIPLSNIFSTLQAYLGSTLRQRLQQVRPYLPRLCPGRSAIPSASRGRGEPEDPQRERRYGPHRFDLQHQVRHGPGSRRALQRLPRIRYQQPGGARLLLRPGDFRHGAGARRPCRMVMASSGPS